VGGGGNFGSGETAAGKVPENRSHACEVSLAVLILIIELSRCAELSVLCLSIYLCVFDIFPSGLAQIFTTKCQSCVLSEIASSGLPSGADDCNSACLILFFKA
jgi:hypothetical protein